VIGHAAWLCVRSALGYRDVEAPLAARGVVVTDETIRRWRGTFGQTSADLLRRRRARPGDKGHRDGTGSTHSLWRAVDQGGTALASRVAVNFLRKRLQRLP